MSAPRIYKSSILNKLYKIWFPSSSQAVEPVRAIAEINQIDAASKKSIGIPIKRATLRLQNYNGESQFVRTKSDSASKCDDIQEWLKTDISGDDRNKAELHAQIRELKRLNSGLSQCIDLINQRNQELDRFVGIVAHDLKVPLRAIANLSQWLEDDLMNQIPSENKEQLQLMRSRIFRMNALIDGLSQYARLGREDIKPETVCVQTLLEEAIDSVAPPPAFKIKIDPMPILFTKRVMLNQVFTNLISNAVRHHDRLDGHIRISGETIIVNDYQQNPVEFYEFAIADDGRGIDLDRQVEIFNIFQTSELRKKTQSSGIGLTIVKKIVETEGGKIRLDSQVGIGSTFYFTWYKS